MPSLFFIPFHNPRVPVSKIRFPSNRRSTISIFNFQKIFSVMARSFSNVKNVSAFIANQISRRGYSAASQSVVSNTVRIGSPNMMLKKGTEESGKTAWVPDPVTGYYRPENLAKEVDPADLREMLLKSKIGQK